MSKSARTQSEPLELPNLCDKSAVLFAVNEVIQAFTQRRVKCSEAEVLIKGLKLASRLMTEIGKDLDRSSEPPIFFSSPPISINADPSRPRCPIHRRRSRARNREHRRTARNTA